MHFPQTLMSVALGCHHIEIFYIVVLLHVLI